MNNKGKLVYALHSKAKVGAIVVDVTGKIVVQFEEENQSEGVHEFSLSNGQLSAGIYFARLSVNGAVYTKKFIATK